MLGIARIEVDCSNEECFDTVELELILSDETQSIDVMDIRAELLKEGWFLRVGSERTLFDKDNLDDSNRFTVESAGIGDYLLTTSPADDRHYCSIDCAETDDE